MDRSINDLTSKFASMSATLDKIRFTVVGEGNRLNREGNNHDHFRSSDEVGDGACGKFARCLRGIDRRDRVVVRWNDNHHGYEEKQGHRFKVENPNFVENLHI
ncbi:hypothetical protein Tco_0771775 [Tanacetum coccineum]|uniref:Uncharacterized protein n=1 Tax=Tanacetum coccineum TaxID=301880 RepID=A0ABQ4ZG29_9ASTR